MDYYICHTPFHLLVSLIKATNSTAKSLVLCRSELIGDDVIERIERSCFFDNIYKHVNVDGTFCEVDNTGRPCKDIKKYIDILDSIITVKFTSKDNIYIFNDFGNYGKWLNAHHIKYHLIEDGVDCYKKQGFVKMVQRGNVGWKRRILSFLGLDVNGMGCSKYIVDVEVNNKKGIFLKHNNIVELPKKVLFSSINENDKKRILELFVTTDFEKKLQEVCFEEECTLLLTQPLAEDGLVSEEQKTRIYRNVIGEYCTGKIIIKPHPREKISTYVDFENCIILEGQNVPIEILGFMDYIHIKRAVTIFSTAIDTIGFCDEKVCLGEEWMKNYIMEK